MDWFMPISGRERSGKTALGTYCCAYDDKNFGIDRYFYGVDPFLKASESLPNGASVLLDEGGEFMFNRDWQSQQSKDLAKALMVCGFKNLFMVFIMPSFSFMDKFIRIHRASALLSTEFWFDDRFQVPVRGWFRAYGAEKLGRIRVSQNGRAVFPHEDFREHVPFVGDLYPELWSQYKELESKRKPQLLKDKVRKEKQKVRWRDGPEVVEPVY